MKLTDLEPIFLRLEELGNEKSLMYHTGDFTTSHGILFWCPVCDNTPRGHYVLCWKKDIPLCHPPGPGRWVMSGTTYEDLTLSPSVQLSNNCTAHFWVKNGVITLC